MLDEKEKQLSKIASELSSLGWVLLGVLVFLALIAMDLHKFINKG